MDTGMQENVTPPAPPSPVRCSRRSRTEYTGRRVFKAPGETCLEVTRRLGEVLEIHVPRVGGHDTCRVQVAGVERDDNGEVRGVVLALYGPRDVFHYVRPEAKKQQPIPSKATVVLHLKPPTAPTAEIATSTGNAGYDQAGQPAV